MSRRDTLKGIFSHTVEELAAANFAEEEAHRGPAGPVRSMALTLGRMEDDARAMHEALVSGQHVQELDPALVDASFVRDRIGEIRLDLDDPFVRSIVESGQEVPILVRPHPERTGRYQVAYGHRRLKAAVLLGIKVKAIVREIADDDLVVAQGVENTARNNLSYIERASFARTLEEKGFGRPLIMKALTTDKTELSKMLSVANAVPDELVRAIGNAPSIGRRKWTALAEALGAKKRPALERLLQSDGFRSADSDRRFEMALAHLAGRAATPAEIRRWMPDGDNRIAADIRSGRRSFTLAFRADEAGAFGEFVAQRLGELYAQFKTSTGD
ncbi:plasmid partitioning protein RepB [Rhizobium sp. TRM95111]|uniref:plasmid partitioning protein RepB n=1 Tax=Rhizobium alarense TaxID=2846851 RepID=UPI001F276DC9|nr:plasmid partitioning protein RepB [Rhizobium alarense]MCF3640287.1 plasmid partitioning protein RepB [Rhizobium alarense]